MAADMSLIDDEVPRFSAKLEAEIRAGLVKRLDREPTDDELSDYRRVLWAFACAVRAIAEDAGKWP